MLSTSGIGWLVRNSIVCYQLRLQCAFKSGSMTRLYPCKLLSRGLAMLVTYRPIAALLFSQACPSAETLKTFPPASPHRPHHHHLSVPAAAFVAANSAPSPLPSRPCPRRHHLRALAATTAPTPSPSRPRPHSHHGRALFATLPPPSPRRGLCGCRHDDANPPTTTAAILSAPPLGCGRPHRSVPAVTMAW